MIRLRLERGFSATHQIRIAGELEPVHGHDFLCRAEVACPDERDSLALEPALAATLAEIERTHLGRVASVEGGHPSAERIARYLYRSLAARLEPELEVVRVSVRESWGCFASYA